MRKMMRMMMMYTKMRTRW